MKPKSSGVAIGVPAACQEVLFTNFLFEQHANIEALEEQVTRGQFSMTVQASWKDGQLDGSRGLSGSGRAGARAWKMEIKVRFTEPRGGSAWRSW